MDLMSIIFHYLCAYVCEYAPMQFFEVKSTTEYEANWFKGAGWPMSPRDLPPCTVVPDIHLSVSDNWGLYAYTVSSLLTEPTPQADPWFESMYIYFNNKA